MDQVTKYPAAHLRTVSITNSHARSILLVLGIALAFGGEVVLLKTVLDSPTEGWMQALAGSMLIAGAILFGALARESLVALPRLEFPRRDARVSPFVVRNRWTLAWVSLSVVLAVLAISAFLKDGENYLVRLIWLASVAALLIASVKSMQFGLPRIPRKERVYLAVLAALLMVAFITRFYKLTLLPYNMDGDFAEFGMIARALATSQEQRIFAYGWMGIPILAYLPAWLSMSVFGTGLFGLYMSGVIEGLVVLVGVYLLGRDLFSARVGIFAAALLTISYTHLAASRQSTFIDPVLFLVFSLYFLLIGLREGRGWAIVVSGLLAALCVQMYYSGRIVVLLVGFILLYLLLFRHPWLWMRRQLLLLWALALLIALGPMLALFALDSTTLMARQQTVFVLNPAIVKHLQGVYGVDTLPAMLLDQARHTLLLFNYYPDIGPVFRFSRPFLDPVTGPLFVLGVGYALFHTRRFGDALMVVWVLLGALFGSFLASDTPSWARLMILLPPTALLAARTLDLLYEPLSRFLTTSGNYLRFVAPAGFAVLIAAMGILNWNTYVELKESYASEVVRMARYLDVQSPSTHCYLVSSKFTYTVRELKFLVPGRCVASLAPEEITANLARVGEPTLLILTNEETAALGRLIQLYPGGAWETHMGNAPDEVAFYLFRLP